MREPYRPGVSGPFCITLRLWSLGWLMSTRSDWPCFAGKEEHGEFLTFQTENNAAVQLIEKAKNRLSLFADPGEGIHQELVTWWL